MFVLGIGEDVDPSELQQIASGPKNVFKVDSFEDLDVKSNEYKRGICYRGILKFNLHSAALCSLSFSFFVSKQSLFLFFFLFFFWSAEQNLRNCVLKQIVTLHKQGNAKNYIF